MKKDSKKKTSQGKKLSAKEMGEVKGGDQINIPHWMNPLYIHHTTHNVASPALTPTATVSSRKRS